MIPNLSKKVVILAAKDMEKISLTDMNGKEIKIPYSQAEEFSANLRNRVNGEMIVEAKFRNKIIRIPRDKVNYVAQSVEEVGKYNFTAYKRTF
jgi:hypothetical protein